MMKDYILEMNHIKKAFADVLVLDDVSLKIKKGSVHALLGENGAGKSTLMKILMGIYKLDSGEILFKNQVFHNSSINIVLEKGISMIYQEINPLSNMKVAENIFLGREPKFKLGILNYKKMYADTQKLFDQLGITQLKPQEIMGNLTVAQMQLVEIVKAVSYHSELIIMDEPTSSLTENECRHLFKIIKQLKHEGVSFIFISHKLEEIFEVSDEITILRDGQWIGNYSISELDKNSIIEMMVGRKVRQLYPKVSSLPGEVAIRVEDLSVSNLFQKISFEARYGEIVGFAGLVGAGRSEVMETVFGYRKKTDGKIFVCGKEVKIKSPADAVRQRVAFLTEDRKRTGLFLALSSLDNMFMPSLKKHCSGLFLKYKQMQREYAVFQRQFKIKTASFKQPTAKLSGGNQQKILVSRWLLTEPDIIILDEPTKGIDIGAKSDIYQCIASLAEKGKCIIMISSEMPEILGMSNRIYVMHEGRMTGELSRDKATQENILKMATGLEEELN